MALKFLSKIASRTRILWSLLSREKDLKQVISGEGDDETKEERMILVGRLGLESRWKNARRMDGEC
jgi:hypothetical protein